MPMEYREKGFLLLAIHEVSIHSKPSAEEINMDYIPHTNSHPCCSCEREAATRKRKGLLIFKTISTRREQL